MPFPHRNTLFVVLGVAACRGREAPPPASDQRVHLQAAATTAVEFQSIAATSRQLWVRTSAGVAVIDPVAERWSSVYVDTQPLGLAQVIPCGSSVWLLGRDAILADAAAERFELRGVPPLTTGRVEARCGKGGLWIFDNTHLFLVPVSHDSTRRYDLPSFGERTSFRDFAEGLPGGVQFLIYDPQAPLRTRLVHFDTATSRLETIDLPLGVGVWALESAEDGLRVRVYMGRRYLLTGRGQAWTEVPQPSDSAGPVLAAENGIVWVGASYDVSPSSYFVLRYIRDAAEPQDLLVLPDFYSSIRGGRGNVVQHLGMLWVVSGPNLLRIDPGADEIVRYRLNPDGTLAKQAFKFTREENGALRYFDGDSVRSLPPTRPTAPDTTPAEPTDSVTADLREKAERERALDRDLLAVQLQVLLRLREIQYPDELGLGPALVPLGHEDLPQGERGRHVLRKRVADELEGRNGARVVAPTGENLSFEIEDPDVAEALACFGQALERCAAVPREVLRQRQLLPHVAVLRHPPQRVSVTLRGRRERPVLEQRIALLFQIT